MRYLDSDSTGSVLSTSLVDFFKREYLKRTGNDLRKGSRESLGTPGRSGEKKENAGEELTKEQLKASSMGAYSGNVEWDTVPLPEEGRWERRIDKKTGKVNE